MTSAQSTFRVSVRIAWDIEESASAAITCWCPRRNKDMIVNFATTVVNICWRSYEVEQANLVYKAVPRRLDIAVRTSSSANQNQGKRLTQTVVPCVMRIFSAHRYDSSPPSINIAIESLGFSLSHSNRRTKTTCAGATQSGRCRHPRVTDADVSDGCNCPIVGSAMLNSAKPVLGISGDALSGLLPMTSPTQMPPPVVALE